MKNTPSFDDLLASLTSRWNAHQELRRSDASIAELSASRAELDEIRDQIRVGAAA
ncbi:MAG: hypothetical protein P8J50_11755 [Acidimicrobiales bacterium]|jgi:hypothetical protein|nr:hypothetical protein [Acidimicrobiales bacterium]